jgi:hypothetical protein
MKIKTVMDKPPILGNLLTDLINPSTNFTILSNHFRKRKVVTGKKQPSRVNKLKFLNIGSFELKK